MTAFTDSIRRSNKEREPSTSAEKKASLPLNSPSTNRPTLYLSPSQSSNISMSYHRSESALTLPSLKFSLW